MRKRDLSTKSGFLEVVMVPQAPASACGGEKLTSTLPRGSPNSDYTYKVTGRERHALRWVLSKKNQPFAEVGTNDR